MTTTGSTAFAVDRRQVSLHPQRSQLQVMPGLRDLFAVCCRVVVHGARSMLQLSTTRHAQRPCHPCHGSAVLKLCNAEATLGLEGEQAMKGQAFTR